MVSQGPASITQLTTPSHVLRDLSEMTVEELQLEVLRLRDELIGAQAEIGNLRGRLDVSHRNYLALNSVHSAQRVLRGSDDDYVRAARRVLGFARWILLRAPRQLARKLLERG